MRDLFKFSFVIIAICTLAVLAVFGLGLFFLFDLVSADVKKTRTHTASFTCKDVVFSVVEVAVTKENFNQRSTSKFVQLEMMHFSGGMLTSQFVPVVLRPGGQHYPVPTEHLPSHRVIHERSGMKKVAEIFNHPDVVEEAFVPVLDGCLKDHSEVLAKGLLETEAFDGKEYPGVIVFRARGPESLQFSFQAPGQQRLVIEKDGDIEYYGELDRPVKVGEVRWVSGRPVPFMRRDYYEKTEAGVLDTFRNKEGLSIEEMMKISWIVF